MFLLLEGWGFRYKQLESGRRQIMAYLIPGDLCDIQIFLFDKMDHSIGLLSAARVVKIPAVEMLDLMDRYPRIERALLWATLVDEATLREWLLNVGQRSALQRISHLFCELCVRLSVVQLVDNNETFELPVTQAELADTTGMTTVHVNVGPNRVVATHPDSIETARRAAPRRAAYADLCGAEPQRAIDQLIYVMRGGD